MAAADHASAVRPRSYQDESYLHGFVGAVGDLQKDGALQDVVLEVEDRRFPCHRLVLSAASPYFRAMFTGDMAESRQKTVVLQGLDADMFEEILSYIYSGTLHVSLDTVQPLYQAADLLQLGYMRDTCSSYMAGNVELSTCVDLYKFADAFSVGNVLKRCLQYICRHFVEVASSEEFCSLSVNQLTEIISHDELDVEEETRVWEAVVRWVQHSREDRLHHLPSILPHIRFNLLTSDDAAAILKHPLLREDPGSFEAIGNVVQEASKLRKRFGMDTQEMACLFNMESVYISGGINEIVCMNPREGKYIRISLPPHLVDKLVVGMTVNSDNNVYILIDESGDHQFAVFEYNQAWKEWEHAGMSPVSYVFGTPSGLDFEEYFVEVDRCLYFLVVRNTANGISVLTRRYVRDTDEWQECSELRVDGGDLTFCAVVPCSSHLYFLTNSEALRYDPVQDQWDQRTPPRNIPRLCTAVAMGTEIFCTDHNFSKIMVYNTESDSWEERRAWQNPGNFVLSPLSHPNLFVFKNQLHIWIELDNNMAQQDGDSVVFVYDRSEDAWRDLNATPPVRCYALCRPMCTMARMYNAPTMS